MSAYAEEPTIGRFKLRDAMSILAQIRRNVTIKEPAQAKQADDLMLALLSALPDLTYDQQLLEWFNTQVKHSTESRPNEASRSNWIYMIQYEAPESLVRQAYVAGVPVPTPHVRDVLIAMRRQYV